VLGASNLYIPRIIASQRNGSPMAFDLDEWNKLSEAQRERRYNRRRRNEERGQNLAVIVAFVLLVWLLIVVFRASTETAVVDPGSAFADRHAER
jgi:hypothetical protein